MSSSMKIGFSSDKFHVAILNYYLNNDYANYNYFNNILREMFSLPSAASAGGC